MPDDPFFQFMLALMSKLTGQPIPKYLTYRGSGVVLGEGRVLTANHVVDEENILLLTGEQSNGKPFGCKVVRKDRERDLALLQCDGINHVAGIKHIASLSLPVGTRVINAGYAGGQRLVFTEGIIGGRDLDKGKTRVSAMSGPGMSGGAVFTLDGSLAGIIQAGYIKPPFTMFAANTLQIRRFLWAVDHEPTPSVKAVEVQHIANAASVSSSQVYPCVSAGLDTCDDELARQLAVVNGY